MKTILIDVFMSETMMAKIDAEHDFLSNIVFLDKATFQLNGIVNRHNCRL